MEEGGQKVLLVAEDDKEMRSLLCDELRDLGCQIVEAGDGNEAIERARETAPSLILTDLRMPGGGLGYIGRLRIVMPTCPIVLITAFGDPSVRETAQRFGISAYFDKPVRMAELKDSIKLLLSHRNGQETKP
ncbi:MAG: response regulator [Nitrospirae bacterium]|nr:response regulator [Nitrospirota bacterium]